MTPKLRFSKDFDSFTVEPDHLDVVYGGKSVRLAYLINGERKFSVQALGNTNLIFPEMLLKCDNQDISNGILVNVQAGFQDVLMLGRFVEKLASVAGYQQVPLDEDNLSANTSRGSEYEEIDEANISNQSEDLVQFGANLEKMNAGRNRARPRPILMFVEDPTQSITYSSPGRGANYFEITHNHSVYRFSCMAGVNCTYEMNPPDFGQPGGNRGSLLVHNLMLQCPDNPSHVPRIFGLRNGNIVVPPGGNPAFVDLIEVDLFVNAGAESSGDLITRLHNHFRFQAG